MVRFIFSLDHVEVEEISLSLIAVPSLLVVGNDIVFFTFPLALKDNWLFNKVTSSNLEFLYSVSSYVDPAPPVPIPDIASFNSAVVTY